MRTKFLRLSIFITMVITNLYAHSQSTSSIDSGEMADMPGMAMPDTAQSSPTTRPSMNMSSPSFIGWLQSHAASGTSAEPASTPAEMIMTSAGNWTLMLHGEAFLNEIQQSGPRGSSKLFSTNWIMPMAQRKVLQGTLTLRMMLSLEPATITGRFYPELFQQGETAYGRPIVDGQHPHNFPMEVAALYDYQTSENIMFSIYAAPVGDPAMGPTAFPHRDSAEEDPIAPLGHHLEDSTHISDDVITAGITYRVARIEASGFHGREPGEFRWAIDSGRIDSWSARVTVNPAANWSSQFSIAQLHSPEAVNPTQDIRRMTASVMYDRPLRHGNWASMLLWGRNRSSLDGNVGNGYLAESTLRFLTHNAMWTRIENVDRTTDLLLEDNQPVDSITERYFARVQAYTLGYDRDLGKIPHLSTAIGSQITWYGVPEILRPIYGAHPVGGVIFLRLRTR